MSDSSLSGTHILITGANTGIGKVTAEILAKRGAKLTLACRSADKTLPVIEAMKQASGNPHIAFAALDLADLASVRSCAEKLLAEGVQIDVLLNNAGLAGLSGLTKDGFELTFGTNHLGHYLFTRLLLDSMKARPRARIVNVSSRAHFNAPGISWEALQRRTASTTGLDEYAVSKLCNVLFTNELARRLASTGITTYSLHPGVVATDVWRQIPGPISWLMKRFMISPERGSLSSIRCATAPELANETGKYYHDDGKEKTASKVALDSELAAQLWQRSAEWVGLEP
jgi:retinol dehydrogenase 12